MKATKKIILIAFSVLVALCLLSCGSSRKVVEQANTQEKDSVRFQTVTVFVKDTVLLEIPAQSSERETRDSTSHLENDYATSDATIMPDGSLFHNLKTKQQKKPVQIEKPVQRTDSIVYRVRTETKIKEVPRKLTWFQQTQIYGFRALIVILLIIYTIKRIKRRIRVLREK